MMKRIVFLLLFLSSAICGEIHHSPVQTLEEITECPFMGWIQQGERWTFQDWMEDKREIILPIIDQLGYFDEKRAKDPSYQYGIVLGSLHASVKRRIAFLIEEWERGVRFDSVVFLTGQRKLHPEKEPFDGLETETEMMVWTWKNAQMPDELSAIPLVVIDAKPHPFRKRPNTLMTIQTWLSQKPSSGKCLVVSCQPYLNYQYQILRMVLPEEFSIEIIGPKGGNNNPLSVLLDTVARTEIMKKGYLLL
ncbi:MAG: hypothetical protein KFB93_06555 [Simkaniaceae bacterium]|nr:MAG: hypothetical protein KFB93_06555 [Simkaniaceae bacterium]